MNISAPRRPLRALDASACCSRSISKRRLGSRVNGSKKASCSISWAADLPAVMSREMTMKRGAASSPPAWRETDSSNQVCVPSWRSANWVPDDDPVSLAWRSACMMACTAGCGRWSPMRPLANRPGAAASKVGCGACELKYWPSWGLRSCAPCVWRGTAPCLCCRPALPVFRARSHSRCAVRVWVVRRAAGSAIAGRARSTSPGWRQTGTGPR